MMSRDPKLGYHYIWLAPIVIMIVACVYLYLALAFVFVAIPAGIYELIDRRIRPEKYREIDELRKLSGLK